MDILQSYLSSDQNTLNPLPSQFLAQDQQSDFSSFASLTERLHSSLDLQRIVQIFADEVAKYVQISGIRIQTEATSVQTERFVEGIYEHITELHINQKSVAILTYASYREFENQDLRLLQSLQNKLTMPVYNGLQYFLLQQQTVKDHLTQLGNRAGFDEQFEMAIARTQRDEQPLTLLVIDLDNFKRANDTYGHEMGDEVLKTFAKILRRCIRRSDLAFRFGGDEFAILLNNAEEDIAMRVASRIQSLVTQSAIMHQCQVSSSIGCAAWEYSETSKQLFRRADSALYHAKDCGKNQLKCA
ncbi:GGDEF domain-containing protein (plasmid) [Catenovulum sp. SX2]|uniref:GGDEF domain-containing protein n=1 Tax=Catenovulum sp. SX2 TaxID=3398614 RepID=UPI003F871FF9